MNNDFNLKIQSHILIGNQSKLTDQINKILQNIFCKKNCCNACIVCNQIKNNAHANILNLQPEKQYTVDQIDLVLSKITHKLQEEEYFFIIFNNADCLTQACSNRLLKTIEEPSRGYYFIFLTNQKDAILPTIRSRSIVSYCDFEQDFLKDDQIYNFFINQNYDPILFMKIADKSTINEKECMQLIHALIQYWSNLCKKNLSEKNKADYENADQTLKILNETFENPPMPGSSKIFLKNLFLKLQNIN